MKSLPYLSGSLLALLCAITATAASGQTVFKCVDAAGKITFTANANCPSHHALDDVVSARNPTISRGEKKRPWRAPR
ncbi:DUF4124 domain-containing protein [Pseudomonas sp. MM227]|uniref:DUF4124 domain-containing protein n=1 Tax=Pseudomonas sp. MM227 TaxID=3019968 RepID=UPI0034605933